MSQHRIVFTKRFYALLNILQANAHRVSHFLLSFQIVGNKFMQRRIEQTNSNRATFHSLEDTLEVGLLIRQNLGQSFTAAFRILSQNHLAHSLDFLTFKEHVFRTAKTDAHCTKVTCHLRVMRSICIGTNLKFGIFIGQSHQLGKVTGKLRSLGFNLTLIYFTRAAVQ